MNTYRIVVEFWKATGEVEVLREKWIRARTLNGAKTSATHLCHAAATDFENMWLYYGGVDRGWARWACDNGFNLFYVQKRLCRIDTAVVLRCEWQGSPQLNLCEEEPTCRRINNDFMMSLLRRNIEEKLSS